MEFLSEVDVIILALGTLILGMAILVKGGDLTIDGAVQIARYYGMPPLLVGFTIVAFGTSLPELIASINANMKDASAIAVGGMVGSNISNILFVAGICAVITPLAVTLRAIRNDLIMLGVVSLAWAAILMLFPVTPVIGAASISILILYIVIQYRMSVKDEATAKPVLDAEIEVEDHGAANNKKAIFLVILGLIGLAIGAELLIRGAVTTARIVGVKESVIGLTLIALGTSLPEMTTCAIAAMKRQTDMIIGNVIGSNIFNLMMVLGGIAMLKSYSVYETEHVMMHQDIPFMLGVTAVFILTLVLFKKIPRWAGMVYALAYAGYMVLLAVQSYQAVGIV